MESVNPASLKKISTYSPYNDEEILYNEDDNTKINNDLLKDGGKLQ